MKCWKLWKLGASRLRVSQLGCTELYFRRSRHKNKRCILSRCSSTTETAASDSTCFRKEFYLPAEQCTYLHIVRVKLWGFCVEKHQTSFLQICGLQTVQISFQLVTRSGLSCSVVFTGGKSTPSTNWSRGWLKFGAALNSRLSTWLLISGAKD